MFETAQDYIFQIPLAKKCFIFNRIFLRKTESFREAASKETCLSLYLRKGKFFIQLYWLLRFTVVAKFCRISVTIKLNSNQQKNKFSLKMCFFVDCSRLTPGARGEHLTSQLSRVAASTFI